MLGVEDAPSSKECARQLKEAFQKADRNGTGFITRRELIDVFQDLEPGVWSEQELAELFGQVDRDGTGFVEYTTFISYIMETPADVEHEEADDDERGGAVFEQLAKQPARRSVELDLDRWVSCDEWVLVMRQLVDEDDEEAKAVYGQRLAELRQRGKSSGRGLPLRELLEELHIDMKDSAALCAVESTLQAAASAQKGVETRTGRGAAPLSWGAPESPASRRAIHQVVRSLYLAQRPFDDVTKILSEGLVPLSEAECLAIQGVGREPGRLVEQVKAYACEPPMLSAVAGLRACHEICSREVSALIARCRAEGKKFTDTAWDVTTNPAAVLYVDGKHPGFDCTVGAPSGTRRLTDIVGTSKLAPATTLAALYGDASGAASRPARATAPVKKALRPGLLTEGSQPGDIVQGRLGTCYLLGAMGAVSSGHPNAVRSLFVKYDVELGIYGMRFNVDGEWTFVVIDDNMPVDEHGELLYARSTDPSEVWCPLLEKAYCKLHTCYEMCDGGQTSEAVSALLGGVSGRLRIAACHQQEPSKYFSVLRGALVRGWLLTTDFLDAANRSAAASPAAAAAVGCAGPLGKCGEALLPSGLIAGHTYSVLKIVEANGHQLVCLRNPWGSGEWTGKWSNRNAGGEWTASMREATQFSGANDGVFWMSITDFVVHSAGVDYARTFGPHWRKVSQYSYFRRGELLATARCDYEAAGEGEISFRAGDQIEVTSRCGSFWWRGRVWCVRAPGTAGSQEGYFPAERVEVAERPLSRFDLRCTAAKGSEEPPTTVVVLSQPNALMQRRFFRRLEDGKHCKDVSYPRLQLCIIGPQGTVVAKRSGRQRCLWVEMQLPAAGGVWRVYARSLDGFGSAFSIKVYAKGCAVGLIEVPGATLAEVSTVPATPSSAIA